MEEKRIVCCTSTGCIEYAPERYRKLGIEFFRIIVNYDDKDYYEGKDLNPYEFFKYEKTIPNPKEHLPHSAIPDYASIKATFDSIVERGYTEAIVVTLSRYLGATYEAIERVGKEYEGKLKVHMVDSKITCFGEGMLAIQAQELVNKGVDTETILKELEWSKAHQEFIGTCAKLDYLIYNGRLKGGKAFMGKLIGIVPVMHFSHEGVLEPFASAVGMKKGVKASIEEVKRVLGDRDPKDYLIWHNFTGEGSIDPYLEPEKEAGIVMNHEDVVASPVTGCHTGPYLAGYGIFMKRREDEPLE